MMPPVKQVRSPGDVPADHTPPHGQSGQPFSVGATHGLLSQPFIVDYLSDDEGQIFVATPLKYLRFDRDSGCVVDGALHSKPSSLGAR